MELVPLGKLHLQIQECLWVEPTEYILRAGPLPKTERLETTNGVPESWLAMMNWVGRRDASPPPWDFRSGVCYIVEFGSRGSHQSRMFTG